MKCDLKKWYDDKQIIEVDPGLADLKEGRIFSSGSAYEEMIIN